MHRFAVLSAIVVACSAAANAYYHYVHYNSRSGPWIPAYERFDLASLPNKTVSYFIEDLTASSVQMAPADTAAGVISQIRRGARVWNDVATSDLRIAFGGIVPPDTHQASPSIEVVFDGDVPPGVVAFAGPQITDTPTDTTVPILRSHIVLNRDLTELPSFGEDFFTTLVHEFGHALGLQHTQTSSAMSTGITRATTKAKPLGADDVAGLSVLYPSAGFAASFGSISGQVLVNGRPANLASVVVITPNGSATSALTAPDGTYRIDAIAPGHYLVYAHPLPPALTDSNEVTDANVTYPLNIDGQPIGPSPVFDTQFYPGVRDPVQAYPVKVAAGANTDSINFSTRARGPMQLHSVETYGFPAQVAVKPPFLGTWIKRQFIVAGGAGLMRDGAPLPGLTVTFLGGGSLLPVKTYPSSNAYAQIDVDHRNFSFLADGPRHLLFSTATDLYILPSGFVQSQTPPPGVTGVDSADSDGGRLALISGTNLSAQTTILFDGVTGQNRGPDDSGRLVVVPPPAPGGHRANVVALNPDGQSSLFLRSDAGVWNYNGDPAAPVSFTVTPSALPAGVDSVVTVDVTGMNFVDGYAAAGLGADVQVKRVWVVSPTKLLVSVSVAQNAQVGAVPVTIVNGLQTVTQPYALQLQAVNPKLPAINSTVINAASGLASVYPGATAVATLLRGSLPSDTPGAGVTINGNAVPTTINADGTLSFQIPQDTRLGPATLRVQIGTDISLPFAINIDPVPPIITAIAIDGKAADADHTVKAGDSVALSVANLADPSTTVDPSQITVRFSDGTEVKSSVATSDSGDVVSFLVPSLAAGPVKLTITIGGRTSPPVQLTVKS